MVGRCAPTAGGRTSYARFICASSSRSWTLAPSYSTACRKDPAYCRDASARCRPAAGLPSPRGRARGALVLVPLLQPARRAAGRRRYARTARQADHRVRSSEARYARPCSSDHIGLCRFARRAGGGEFAAAARRLRGGCAAVRPAVRRAPNPCCHKVLPGKPVV